MEKAKKPPPPEKEAADSGQLTVKASFRDDRMKWLPQKREIVV